MLYNVKNIQEIVDDLTAKTIQNKKNIYMYPDVSTSNINGSN